MAGLDSEVAIVNSALIRLGQQAITSLTDDTNEAILSNVMYYTVRDAVLASHPWNEATKRATLAAAATAPNWGFAAAFPVPADYIRLIRLEDGTQRFRIEKHPGASDSIVIATSGTALKITYVFKLEVVPQMSELMKQAISARLTAELSIPITGSASKHQQYWQLYQQFMAEAQYQDSMQAPIDTINGTTWFNAHFREEQDFRGIGDAQNP